MLFGSFDSGPSCAASCPRRPRPRPRDDRRPVSLRPGAKRAESGYIPLSWFNARLILCILVFEIPYVAEKKADGLALVLVSGLGDIVATSGMLR